MTVLENHLQSIGFDPVTGALASLYSKSAGREFLSPDAGEPSSPLAVWHSPTGPYLLSHRTYLFDVLPPDPGDCYAENFHLVPDAFTISDNRLCCRYRDADRGVEADLRVTLDGIRSVWQLRITNNGTEAHEILPVFPIFGGIALSKQRGRMLVMNQGGHVGELWCHRGGAYGVAFHNSAQFGCLFEEDACLGFYVADADFEPKDIRYACPSVSVRWFRPRMLQPGQSITLPETVLMLYSGSWKQTAAAYGNWFRETVRPPKTPEWVRYNDSYTGAWAEKRNAQDEPDIQLINAMDTFEDLPASYIRRPFETLEYAFYCSGSMPGVFTADGATSAAHFKRHTDGVNIIRPDLGGPDALKKGVAAVHRMGRKFVLYIEGLIVPGESELFHMIPEAKNWIVHNPGGDNEGPYTGAGWLHMCPGCTGWQDHLTETVARLIREADIDGIRLDSLGAYHWHCYNPAHLHDSPFSYNRWIIELLEKVGKAARALKPDFLLSTEHPVDYCYTSFNHALHQIIRPADLTRFASGTSPMRVAFPDYKIVYWGGGGVPGSLQLMPDGYGRTDESVYGRMNEYWKNIRAAAAETLVEGRTDLPDPTASRSDMFCRWVRGRGEDAVIGARPVTDVNDPDIQKNEMLPLPDAAETEVTVPLGYEPRGACIYDIAKQTLSPLSFSCDGINLRFITGSNWFLALFDKEPKPAPTLLRGPDSIAAGETLVLYIDTPRPTETLRGTIEVNGMEGCYEIPVQVPGVLSLPIGRSVQRGQYIVRLSGERIRPARKIVRID